jgi:hypothetical protein
MTFHLDMPYLNYILELIDKIEKSTNNILKTQILKIKEELK